MTPTELLQQIDRSLREPSDARPGLLDGDAGRALYRAYAYRLTGDDAQLDQLHALLARCLTAIAGGTTSYSHCSGLAGIAWAIQHLIAEGFIEPPDDFDEVDAALFPHVIASLNARRLDFLHDGLGGLLYAIERLPAARARGCITAALDRIDRAFAAPARTNLGLAHGMPAALVLACLADERGVPCRPTIRRLAEQLVAARHPDGASLYPNEVAGGAPIGPPSRLGWCYGDLGIAIALLHTGARLGDPAFLAEARRILAHTLARRDADNGSIADASLCHGSAGVAHMFRRAAIATGDPCWLAGAERWLAHTVAIAGGPHGLAFRLRDRYVACEDLLQGTAGVGLAVIAALDPSTPPAWDRCLLLS